ncbi:hypothetical protein E3N88_43052 [Mikania micrantha]|uniref:Uncharacterized protein n=1 Tax=Mikania micrantha TaxID=192012 RepID=A0A5N6LG02_9ASTR|nr:hypothetical protein E3N88_43052 [Mikania micrantha]
MRGKIVISSSSSLLLLLLLLPFLGFPENNSSSLKDPVTVLTATNSILRSSDAPPPATPTMLSATTLVTVHLCRRPNQISDIRNSQIDGHKSGELPVFTCEEESRCAKVPNPAKVPRWWQWWSGTEAKRTMRCEGDSTAEEELTRVGGTSCVKESSLAIGVLGLVDSRELIL